jgi:hypothetical protein
MTRGTKGGATYRPMSVGVPHDRDANLGICVSFGCWGTLNVLDACNIRPLQSTAVHVVRLVDGRLGSRLRGYHPIAPRPLRYGPFAYCL